MKPIKSIATLVLLFIALSLSAQRVHYKDNYYTLVNSKIFHLGHNVHGKLTQGERDTLYMIARELYNDKGKMKPHYKNRRKRDRYKLPEGFWEEKAREANAIAEKPETALVEEAKPQKAEQANVSISEEETIKDKAQKKEEKDTVEEVKTFKTEKLDTASNTNKKERSEEKDKNENKEAREKAVKEKKESEDDLKRENAEKEMERKEEKLARQENREDRKEEKAERKEEKEVKKEERKQEKAEKEQKQKEKELKAKEKAIKNHKEAKKKLKNTETKYKKLKEKGELSPNDEAEWLEKIEKLKEKLAKAEKKVD